MKPDYKLVAKAKYIHTTADLASELWHEVYKRYYPAKQLDTLVDTLQSADAIEEDIDNDVNYFLVLLGGKVALFPARDVSVSLMSQYVPMGNLPAPLDRGITREEYDGALSWMELCGLTGYWQDFSSATTEYLPDFGDKGLLYSG